MDITPLTDKKKKPSASRQDLHVGGGLSIDSCPIAGIYLGNATQVMKPGRHSSPGNPENGILLADFERDDVDRHVAVDNLGLEREKRRRRVLLPLVLTLTLPTGSTTSRW